MKRDHGLVGLSGGLRARLEEIAHAQIVADCDITMRESDLADQAASAAVYAILDSGLVVERRGSEEGLKSELAGRREHYRKMSKWLAAATSELAILRRWFADRGLDPYDEESLWGGTEAQGRAEQAEAKLAVAVEALRIVAGFTQQMTSMRGNSTFDQMKRSREVCKKALDKIGEKVE